MEPTITPNAAPVAPAASAAKPAITPGNPMFGGPGKPVAGGRPFSPRDSRGGSDRRGGPGAGRGRGPAREPRAKPEFDQKIISIRRVTRVASGGRRFSFSVSLVAGNRKGQVGVGIGKASDTSLAIDKALKNAKKHLLKVALTKGMTIPHEVEAKYCGSRVVIMPARGKGIVAGSSVRSVIELAGMNDVTAKILSRSKNPLNNARVAIKALSMIRPASAAYKDAAAGKMTAKAAK